MLGSAQERRPLWTLLSAVTLLIIHDHPDNKEEQTKNNLLNQPSWWHIPQKLWQVATVLKYMPSMVQGISPVTSMTSLALWKRMLALLRHFATSFCKLWVSVCVSHNYSFCGTHAVNLGIATAISQSNHMPCCITTAVIAGWTTHHILAIVSITHDWLIY